MVAKDWAHEDGVDLPSWQAALAATTAWELNLDAASGVIGLVDGSAEGILYGGCLSILVASLGTPYEIRTLGTILFLEDVAAKPYQIDRMLMQLKLAGKFEACRNCFRRDAELCSKRKPRLQAGRRCAANRGRAGNSSGVWRALRPCDGKEYHTANRSAFGIGRARWTGEGEDSGRGRNHDIGRQLTST